MEKMTKKDYFAKIREIVAGDAELVAFVDHEVELLNKKRNSGALTKTQKENEGIKEVIVEALSKVEGAVTVTDLIKGDASLAEYSNQKVSALVKQLVEAGRVEKTVEKGKSYFSVVA